MTETGSSQYSVTIARLQEPGVPLHAGVNKCTPCILLILSAILQSHHLDKFYKQLRLLLGQGCSVVQSNLSLCQYVKTPIFSLVMSLLVQKLL